MNQDLNNSIVPIHVWIKAFILSCILFGGGYFFIEIRDEKLSGAIPLDKKFISVSNINHPNEKITLYILGSSLTNNAFCKFNTIKAELEKKQNKIVYKVVCKSAARPNEASIFISEIKALRPKYLFLEANLFCVDMSGKGIDAVSNLLQSYSIRLSRFPIFIIRNPSYVSKIFSSPIPQDYADKYLKVDKANFNWNYYANTASGYRVRKIDELPEWNTFFKEAMDMGIEVFLIDIPRAKESRQYLPDGFNKKFYTLIDKYKTTYNVHYRPFPNNLSFDKYYEDAAHFNQEGSKLYTTWFVGFLLD